MYIGCDTGGTFTDFVMFDPSQPKAGLQTLKLSSTPDDPSRAVLQGIALLCGDDPPTHVNHATTVATNALLEGEGGRVAFFVTRGFRDLLWLGRGNRLNLYDLAPSKTLPPLRATDCHEVEERISANGKVLKALELPSIELPSEITASAICFLHSTQNGDHERTLKKHLEASGQKVFCSSEIAPGSGEYERGMTCLIAATLCSKVEKYIDQLSQGLFNSNLMIVHSAGGLLNTKEAQAFPHRLALSGPAAGLRGALAVGIQCGEANLVTLDMGGTSTDVALLNEGALPYHWESEVAGLSLRAPTLKIHTIGAGGGSLATVDLTGLLRVGPLSAGAQPGPACYGRGGTRPTITDALCYNGFLPETLGDEDWPVVLESAQLALEGLGTELGLDERATADGILAVATDHLAGAVRRVTTARGQDPAAFTLFPFGGAGPLLSCAVAEDLEMSRILVPKCAGVLSAWGALTAPWEREWSQSLPKKWRAQPELWERSLGLLRMEASRELAQEPGIRWTKLVARRYIGQGESIVSEPEIDFHELHASHFGFRREGHAVEAVEVRIRATKLAIEAAVEDDNFSLFENKTRQVRWQNHTHEVPYVVGFPHFRNKKMGPILIFDQSSTIFVAPGWSAQSLSGGHLLLRHEEKS